MQVLPYLIVLVILPQIQANKYSDAKIIKIERYKLTAKNLYQALEIQMKMQMQIIIRKLVVHVQVEKEDFLEKLSKRENYVNQSFLRRLR